MKYKLVAFDVDGTLVDELQYIWTMLHSEMGVDLERLGDASERFYSGDITFKEWADHDIALWIEMGVTREDIMRCIKKQKLKLMRGAMETINELKKRGYRLAIISGGLDIVLEHFIPDAGKIYDHIIINRLVFDDDGRLNGVMVPEEFDSAENKAGCLKMLAEKEGITLDECVFVGDSDNDIGIMQAAGLGIGFNPTKKLEKVCDAVITKKDLREVLRYL